MMTRITVDLAEVRQQREREKRIDNFMNTLCDIYGIERKRLPEGLKAKVECILACPYDDLKQNLSDVLAVLTAIRSERDAEEPEASQSRHRSHPRYNTLLERRQNRG